MKLSIIIVNFNVRAFLEQCLRSVQEAMEGLDAEVIVVDNQSTDGSVEMLRQRFPAVRVIPNRTNVGFSRANNQAIRESKGEYVLLLNPDTVVGEDVFRKVVSFLDTNPQVGGLGVKMIDGTGRFLPESKRGLPTPSVAFFKIMGLSRIFPHSKLFGRYHLGHLPEDEPAPIEILSGACMFLRRSVLDKVGLLDESFFMYGEDIDLSYRITLGGHGNWYLPDARIIHYKGESTKKSSVNYVFVFYNAMVIFARKHFTRRGPQFFSFIIRGAIYLSAAAAIVARFFRGILFPLLDAALLSLALWLVHLLGHGPAIPVWEGVLAVCFTLACLAVSGAYDMPVKPLRAAIGMAVVILISGVAALLTGIPAAPLVPGFMAAALLILLLRYVPGWLRVPRGAIAVLGKASVLAIGSADEARTAIALLWQTHFGLKKTLVREAAAISSDEGIAAIRDLARREGVDEVVFCARDLRMEDVIKAMEQLRQVRGVVFKIAQPGSSFIIGPGTTESLQDLLLLRDHTVRSSASVRRRKLLDIGLSLMFLCLLPLTIWFVEDKAGFVRNLLGIITGRFTWVGYSGPGHDRRIPALRPGVLNPVVADGYRSSPVTVKRMDLEYAKDYHVWKDMARVLSNFRRLGTLPMG